MRRRRSLEVTEAILVSAVVKLVAVLGTQFCHQKGRKVARNPPGNIWLCKATATDIYSCQKQLQY